MEIKNVLAIGRSKRIERLYCQMEKSEHIFNMPFAIVEDEEVCDKEYSERNYLLVRLSDIVSIDLSVYQYIFICSNQGKILREILVKLGVKEKCILDDVDISLFLKPLDKMLLYKELLYNCYQKKYVSDNIHVGDFTYGTPKINNSKMSDNVIIGKFCSIAKNVCIFTGEEHRYEWGSTYPFNEIVTEYSHIEGGSTTKGEVRIGNDVWMGNGCTILSGVTIGDGAAIGANALVDKDVPPYAIVAGNPAHIIKYRFDEKTIEKFMEMKWWNWKYEDICNAISLLQSNQIDKLFEYYEQIVSKKVT